MTTQASLRELAPIWAGLFLVGLAAILFMAGYEARVPEVHVADNARQFFSWMAGTLVLLAGGAVAVIATFQVRPLLILVGVIVVIVGLTVVGITIGVPPVLEPFLDVLNALVRVLNLLLNLLDKLV